MIENKPQQQQEVSSEPYDIEAIKKLLSDLLNKNKSSEIFKSIQLAFPEGHLLQAITKPSQLNELFSQLTNYNIVAGNEVPHLQRFLKPDPSFFLPPLIDGEKSKLEDLTINLLSLHNGNVILRRDKLEVLYTEQGEVIYPVQYTFKVMNNQGEGESVPLSTLYFKKSAGFQRTFELSLIEPNTLFATKPEKIEQRVEVAAQTSPELQKMEMTTTEITTEVPSSWNQLNTFLATIEFNNQSEEGLQLSFFDKDYLSSLRDGLLKLLTIFSLSTNGIKTIDSNQLRSSYFRSLDQRIKELTESTEKSVFGEVFLDTMKAIENQYAEPQTLNTITALRTAFIVLTALQKLSTNQNLHPESIRSLLEAKHTIETTIEPFVAKEARDKVADQQWIDKVRSKEIGQQNLINDLTKPTSQSSKPQAEVITEPPNIPEAKLVEAVETPLPTGFSNERQYISPTGEVTVTFNEPSQRYYHDRAVEKAFKEVRRETYTVDGQNEEIIWYFDKVAQKEFPYSEKLAQDLQEATKSSSIYLFERSVKQKYGWSQPIETYSLLNYIQAKKSSKSLSSRYVFYDSELAIDPEDISKGLQTPPEMRTFLNREVLPERTQNIMKDFRTLKLNDAAELTELLNMQRLIFPGLELSVSEVSSTEINLTGLTKLPEDQQPNKGGMVGSISLYQDKFGKKWVIKQPNKAELADTLIGEATLIFAIKQNLSPELSSFVPTSHYLFPLVEGKQLTLDGNPIPNGALVQEYLDVEVQQTYGAQEPGIINAKTADLAPRLLEFFKSSLERNKKLNISLTDRKIKDFMSTPSQEKSFKAVDWGVFFSRRSLKLQSDIDKALKGYTALIEQDMYGSEIAITPSLIFELFSGIKGFEDNYLNLTHIAELKNHPNYKEVYALSVLSTLSFIAYGVKTYNAEVHFPNAPQLEAALKGILDSEASTLDTLSAIPEEQVKQVQEWLKANPNFFEKHSLV